VTEVPLAADPRRLRLRSDLARAAGVFAAVLATLLVLLVGSALLLAGPPALWTDAGPVRLARFCAGLALVTAYTIGAIVFVTRGARRDFAALRAFTATSGERWNSWERRFASRRGSIAAAAIGACLGLGIDQLGEWLGGISDDPWAGLAFWSALLNALCFASLGLLARWSVLEIMALRAIGRRVRVSLLDRGALAPFVRAGLRNAVAWLLGSSLATTLLFDVNSPWIVGVVLAATMALGVAALLLPSAGINERLRAGKAHELAWVRGEIAAAREALGRGDASGRLPALLAWEARVADTSTWPFDPPTLARFALLLLVPLGSWLGGALVERVVDRLIGG
jgi:hypothetical protein